MRVAFENTESATISDYQRLIRVRGTRVWDMSVISCAFHGSVIPCACHWSVSMKNKHGVEPLLLEINFAPQIGTTENLLLISTVIDVIVTIPIVVVLIRGSLFLLSAL